MTMPVELRLRILDDMSQTLKVIVGASNDTTDALDATTDAARRVAEAEQEAAAAAERLATKTQEAARAAADMAGTEQRLAAELKTSEAATKAKAKALGLTVAEMKKVERQTKANNATLQKEAAALKKAAEAARDLAAVEAVVAAETKAVGEAAKQLTQQERQLAAQERKTAQEVEEAAVAFRRKAQALGLTKVQLTSVERKLKDLENAERRATQASQKNRQSLMGVSTALQTVTLAALAAAAGIVKLNQDQADYVNTVNDLARNLDFQASTLQALGVAAGDAGRDLGSLQELLTGFNSRLEQAKNGTGEAVEALGDLGFGEDQLRSFASTDEAFRTITDRLVEMGDRTAAAGLASRIFGEQGSQLFSILQDGTQTLDAANARVQKFGVSTTGEAAERAAEWQRQVTDVDLAYQGLTGTLAVEYGPTIVETIGDSLELIQTLRGLTEGTGELLGSWKEFNAFSLAFKGLSAIFEFWRDLFREIGDKVSEILGLAKVLDGLRLLAQGPEGDTSAGPPAVTVFDNDEANGTAPVITEVKGEGKTFKAASDAITQEQEALALALQAFEVATAVGAQDVQDLGVALDALAAGVGSGALTAELTDVTGRLTAAAAAAATALETTLGERAFSAELAPLEATIADINASTLGLRDATKRLAKGMEEGAKNVEAAIEVQQRATQSTISALTGDISGLLEDGLRKTLEGLAESLGEDSQLGAKFAAAAAGPVGAALAALEAVGAAGGETPAGEARVSSQAGARSAEAIGKTIEDVAANILNGILALPGLLIEFLPEFAVDLARAIAKLPLNLAAGVFESLDGLLKKMFGEAWEDVKAFFQELFRQDPDRKEKRQQRREERRAERDKRDGLGFSLAGRTAAPEQRRSVQEQIQALIGPQAVQSFNGGPRFSQPGVLTQVDRFAAQGVQNPFGTGGGGGTFVINNNGGVVQPDGIQVANKLRLRQQNTYGRGIPTTPYEGS